MGRKSRGKPKRKDIAAKRFFSLRDVFADLCNSIIFEKPGYIQPEDVQDVPTEHTYHLGKQLGSRFRDIYKKIICDHITVALIGVENQSEIDETMPIRIMGYDWLSYDKQLKDIKAARSQRNKRLKKAKSKGLSTNNIPAKPAYLLSPVITIVLYFGTDKPWNRDKSLRSCVSVPESLEKFFCNYKIHVIELAWLSDEEIEQLTGDFKNLAEQLKESRINGRLKNTSSPIDHFEEFSEILAAYTDDDEVTELFKLADKEENMGGIVAKMREEAIAEEKQKRIEAENLLQREREQSKTKDKNIQTMVEFVKNKDLKGLEAFIQETGLTLV